MINVLHSIGWGVLALTASMVLLSLIAASINGKIGDDTSKAIVTLAALFGLSALLLTL